MISRKEYKSDFKCTRLQIIKPFINMKLINRKILFLKIWILHLFALYIPLGFCFHYNVFTKLHWSIVQKKFLIKVLVSPFIGFFLFDVGLLYLFTLSMLFLVFKLNISFFKAYCLSYVISVSGIILFFQIIPSKYTVGAESGESSVSLVAILVCFFIAILINWLVFRKLYRRLEENSTKQI